MIILSPDARPGAWHHGNLLSNVWNEQGRGLSRRPQEFTCSRLKKAASHILLCVDLGMLPPHHGTRYACTAKPSVSVKQSLATVRSYIPTANDIFAVRQPRADECA